MQTIDIDKKLDFVMLMNERYNLINAVDLLNNGPVAKWLWPVARIPWRVAYLLRPPPRSCSLSCWHSPSEGGPADAQA